LKWYDNLADVASAVMSSFSNGRARSSVAVVSENGERIVPNAMDGG